jgi:hypothetical protein
LLREGRRAARDIWKLTLDAGIELTRPVTVRSSSCSLSELTALVLGLDLKLKWREMG